jgi:hypothetical protein
LRRFTSLPPPIAQGIRRFHGIFLVGTASALCELHRNLENVMLATAAALSVNPLFLRHDLMIELGRLEMAIEDVRGHAPANDQHSLAPLETKLARINEALDRLSA